MKLEVGMYVRTKRDGIGKVISLSIGEEDECCFIELSNRRTGIKEHNIIGEPSFEVIDLIQEGDYVNGKLVAYIEDIYTSDNIFIGKYLYEEDKSLIGGEEDIKTVLTKEQMEAMQYEVVEE